MPTTIGRDEVQRLVADGAQLVDVLGEEEYEYDHLPGAVNLPLRRLDAEAGGVLDTGRPVVAYCNDFA
jgi:rhodanese-related sulfurtransferase